MENRTLFRRLFLVNFAITLGFGIADAFFSMYLYGLGARGIILGLPLVIYSVSKIALSPLLGGWSDRIGCGRAMALSLGLYLFVSVGYFCSSSLVAITALRLLQGASCALFRPVLLSLVGQCSSAQKRATAMGTFDISFYGALSLGPLLGGMIKDAWGFRGIFAAVSVLCILALAAALHTLPAQKVTGEEREGGSGAGDWKELWKSSRHAPFRGLLAFIFGRACGISLMGAFLPIALSTRLGLSGTQSGLVMASSTLVITLMLRPVGVLSDHAPRKMLVVVGGTVVSLLYFLIPAAPGFHQVLMLVVSIGLFSVLSQPASTALLVEQGSRHGMGLTVGTFNCVLNLGFVSGPLLGAVVQSAFGLSAVFHAAGVLGLGAVALFAAQFPEPEQVRICGGDALPAERMY